MEAPTMIATEARSQEKRGLEEGKSIHDPNVWDY